MTPPTIWTPESQAAAREACQLWTGTRHANRIAVPGQGVDCIRFVFEIVIAGGILPRFTLPAYDERLGVLREKNVMETIIREYAHAERVPADAAPEFGDVAIFKCGDQCNHAGIVIDSQVWHVPGRSRVGPEAWPTVAKKLQCLMRFTAPGFKQDPATLTWEKIRASI